jgi:hypothetical protein
VIPFLGAVSQWASAASSAGIPLPPFDDSTLCIAHLLIGANCQFSDLVRGDERSDLRGSVRAAVDLPMEWQNERFGSLKVTARDLR